MILYEFPFHEGIRTMLRLEHLFERLGALVARETAVDHHYALATLFEILDVSSRADLKSDVLKELDKHRGQLGSYRGNPSISEAALEAAIGRIDHAFDALNNTQGKAGAALNTDDVADEPAQPESGIPGGTFEFDLPSYHAWRHLEPARRAQRPDRLGDAADAARRGAQGTARADARFGACRTRSSHRRGQYQQSLPQGRSYQLLRVRPRHAGRHRARDHPVTGSWCRCG